ncbi:hypothetical protein Hdeb2414_s0068g00769671 [Helianthus debilis subsp. tardiflorus]
MTDDGGRWASGGATSWYDDESLCPALRFNAPLIFPILNQTKYKQIFITTKTISIYIFSKKIKP